MVGACVDDDVQKLTRSSVRRRCRTATDIRGARKRLFTRCLVTADVTELHQSHTWKNSLSPVLLTPFESVDNPTVAVPILSKNSFSLPTLLPTVCHLVFRSLLSLLTDFLTVSSA